MTAAPCAADGTVYLVHFDAPLAHARHYIGVTWDLPARLEQHALGRGSRLLAAVRLAGIPWRVVRTWPGGDRRLERRLKTLHGARLCPEPACREAYLAARRARYRRLRLQPRLPWGRS